MKNRKNKTDIHNLKNIPNKELTRQYNQARKEDRFYCGKYFIKINSHRMKRYKMDKKELVKVSRKRGSVLIKEKDWDFFYAEYKRMKIEYQRMKRELAKLRKESIKNSLERGMNEVSTMISSKTDMQTLGEFVDESIQNKSTSRKKYKSKKASG